ncbi:MAG TPA: hypothetical protein VMT66_07645 [Steroidobacteraceae bacterium]|nr:hypothetical protein [Steroidobacteraceae bacterium]
MVDFAGEHVLDRALAIDRLEQPHLVRAQRQAYVSMSVAAF